MTASAKKHLKTQTIDFLSSDEGKRKFVDLLMESLDERSMDVLAKWFDCPHEDSAEDKEFAKRIGITNYAPDEKRAFELISTFKLFEFRRNLLANSISSTGVAEMLGVSRQTPHDRAKAGQLLGILDNNVLKFPEWQFDARGPNGVVQGLPEVLQALKCSTFAKISWLATPNAIFEGVRPIDALRMGRIEDVLYEAAAVGVS